VFYSSTNKSIRTVCHHLPLISQIFHPSFSHNAAINALSSSTTYSFSFWFVFWTKCLSCFFIEYSKLPNLLISSLYHVQVTRTNNTPCWHFSFFIFIAFSSSLPASLAPSFCSRFNLGTESSPHCHNAERQLDLQPIGTYQWHDRLTLRQWVHVWRSKQALSRRSRKREIGINCLAIRTSDTCVATLTSHTACELTTKSTWLALWQTHQTDCSTCRTTATMQWQKDAGLGTRVNRSSRLHLNMPWISYGRTHTISTE